MIQVGVQVGTGVVYIGGWGGGSGMCVWFM